MYLFILLKNKESIAWILSLLVKSLIYLNFAGVTALAVLKTGELLIGTGDGIVCRATLTELVIKDPVKKLEDKSSKNKKSKPKTEMRLRETE